jgi:hypothetical protein
MAWSLAEIAPRVDTMFSLEGKKYRLLQPSSMTPRVIIQHEGELSQDSIGIITALFPEGVRVDFIGNVTIAESNEPVRLVQQPSKKRIGRQFNELGSTQTTPTPALRRKEKKATRVV